MNILMWLIFGALVGWIASLIMKTDAEQGAMANIIVGIVGAFIGGFISNMLGGNGISEFSIGNILLAVLGSVILLALIRMFKGKSAAPRA
jgi:uncharacterized membrane protein YeaQ/YmgE (transglycosylase-associated protein family)